MKKLFLLSLFIVNSTFAQNYSETILDGTKPILRANGYGTAPSFTQKVSILGHSGSISTTSEIIGVMGYSGNSSTKNYGVYGYANGNSSTGNYGVYGFANVNNASGYGIFGSSSSSSIAADFLYGGYFLNVANSGINGGALSYGVYAQTSGAGAISSSSGLTAISTNNVSTVSQGVFAESIASGGGNEIGGTFTARGSSTGVLKIGVSANVSGSTAVANKHGVQSSVTGSATTTARGIFSVADNSGNGTSYGGYFEGKGAGIGNKYGIYATASGTGTKYAAHLDGQTVIGTLNTQHIKINNSQIDAYDGVTPFPLYLNNNSQFGVVLSGGLAINTGNLSLSNFGNINRPESGNNADLIPIAYGNVSATGVVQTAASTNNISVTKPATGTYQITVGDELFAPALNAYTVFCNIKDTFGFITPSGNGTNLIISTANTSGTLTDKPFTFVVYKK